MKNISLKKLYIKTTVVFTLSFIYTFTRYNLFGNVKLDDIPTLIFNKSISLTIVLLLVLIVLEKIKGKNVLLEEYEGIIKQLAIMHVLLSLALLSPNYFPKMYLDGNLTVMANISILTGVILFSYLINKFIKPKGWLIYSLIASHVLFLGYKGWVTPEKWHGNLPPLTLISFVLMLLLILLNIFRVAKKTKAESKK